MLLTEQYLQISSFRLSIKCMSINRDVIINEYTINYNLIANVVNIACILVNNRTIILNRATVFSGTRSAQTISGANKIRCSAEIMLGNYFKARKFESRLHGGFNINTFWS